MRPCIVGEPTNVMPVTVSASPGAWVSEYDYTQRRVTLTLTDPSIAGHHWSGIRKDQALSDPGGDFDVFVTDCHERNSELFDNPEVIVKIVATLSDDGSIRSPHPDFNTLSVGSPTIWPYKVAGERFGLAHWIWWATDQPFGKQPRPWTEAIRDR